MSTLNLPKPGYIDFHIWLFVAQPRGYLYLPRESLTFSTASCALVPGQRYSSSGVFSGSPHFTVAGGTITNATRTYPIISAVLPGTNVGLRLSSGTDGRYSCTTLPVERSISGIQTDRTYLGRTLDDYGL
jgi:hypothetical protein